MAQGRPNLTGDFTFETEGLQGVDVRLMEANALSDEEFLEAAKDADGPHSQGYARYGEGD